MKNLITKIAVAFFLCTLSLNASNEAEVEKLVDKAYQFCKAEGIEACSKAFNNKDPRFTQGQLYVFVSKLSGISIAHGGNPKLAGKDLSKVKSPSGIYPGVEMGKIAAEKGSGWLDYSWSHPVTKRITDKRTFVKRYEGQDILIGSGFYK